jgi:hypothetical protein
MNNNEKNIHKAPSFCIVFSFLTQHQPNRLLNTSLSHFIAKIALVRGEEKDTARCSTSEMIDCSTQKLNFASRKGKVHAHRVGTTQDNNEYARLFYWVLGYLSGNVFVIEKDFR